MSGPLPEIPGPGDQSGKPQDGHDKTNAESGGSGSALDHVHEIGAGQSHFVQEGRNKLSSPAPRFVGEKDGPPTDLEEPHEKALGQVKKGNHSEAVASLLPEGLPEGFKPNEKLLEAIAPLVDKEYAKVLDADGNPIEGADEQFNQQKLQQLSDIVIMSHQDPDKARQILDSMEDIPEDVKGKIREQIPEQKVATEEERPLTQEEQASKDRAEGLINNANEQIDQEIKELQEDMESNPDKYNSKTQRFLRNRIDALHAKKEQFEHWLKAPPSEWAGRAGKVLLVTIILFTLLIIWEMSLINKAAKK